MSVPLNFSNVLSRAQGHLRETNEYLLRPENKKSAFIGTACGALAYTSFTILTGASFSLVAFSGFAVAGLITAIAIKFIKDICTYYNNITIASRPPREWAAASAQVPRIARSQGRAAITFPSSPQTAAQVNDGDDVRPPDRPYTEQLLPAGYFGDFAGSDSGESDGWEPYDPAAFGAVHVPQPQVQSVTSQLESQESVPQTSAEAKEQSERMWNRVLAKKIDSDRLETFMNELKQHLEENQALFSEAAQREGWADAFDRLYDPRKWGHLVVDFAFDKVQGDKTAIECWKYCKDHSKEFGNFILKENMKTEKNQNYPLTFFENEIKGNPALGIAINERTRPVFERKIDFYTNLVFEKLTEQG